MVKVLYKLFLAAMIALFIGFGVAVFYKAPEAPKYPTELSRIDGKDLTESEKQAEADFNAKQDTYSKDFAVYSRNVSVIVIAVSVIILVLSLTILLPISIIGDGVLLGALLTLIYGIIRGFMSNDSKFQFIVVTVGLIVAFVLGYVKFIRPEQIKKSRS